MLSKETILHMLETDKRAVARALLVLTDRQTADEQATENTRYLNGMGFRPCHARMGTSMAKFFRRTGYLTDKQIAYWRGRDKTGAMRIGIYWKQLQEAAAMKKADVGVVVLAPPMAIAPAVDPASTPAAAGRDFGNDMERKMVLQEQLGDVLDSDDPKIIDPIAKEIDEIDAFWEKIRKQA
jgi:hypothetical protein